MRYFDYLLVNRSCNEPVVGRFARLDTGADHPWTCSHIRRYLRDKDVPFTSLRHSVAYTASEIAHAAQISGNLLAKTVRGALAGQLSAAAGSHAAT